MRKQPAPSIANREPKLYSTASPAASPRRPECSDAALGRSRSSRTSLRIPRDHLPLPEDGRIFRSANGTSNQLLISTAEEEIAQAVFDHGRKAGKGMERFPEAAATYVPLKGVSRIVGVMAILPGPHGETLKADQQHLLDLFANQTALAIERTLSQNAADDARVQMETEEMRSSLLSAVSHDLRTPLASITGAATARRSQSGKLAPEVLRRIAGKHFRRSPAS